MKKDNFKLKIVITILISLILIIITMLIDFLNCLSFISSQLNTSLLEIIINNIILIMIFLITYFLIDNRNMKKDEEKKKNQEYVLKELLLETYSECKKIIELMDNNEMLIKYIVPKVDFDKSDLDNIIVSNLKNNPFKNENSILDLFKEGICSTTYLHNYLSIKSKYQEYVSIRITLFDAEELTNNQKNKLKENLEIEITSINKDE